MELNSFLFSLVASTLYITVRFIHVVVCMNTLSSFIAEYISILWDISQFIFHSPIHGYLSCFQMSWLFKLCVYMLLLLLDT